LRWAFESHGLVVRVAGDWTEAWLGASDERRREVCGSVLSRIGGVVMLWSVVAHWDGGGGCKVPLLRPPPGGPADKTFSPNGRWIDEFGVAQSGNMAEVCGSRSSLETPPHSQLLPFNLHIF